MPGEVTIVEAPPPSPPPAPKSTITPSSMPAPTTPAAPAKPGSAKERMFADLRKKAVGSDPATPPAPKAPETPPAPKAPETPAPETPETPETPDPGEQPKPGEQPDPKAKKANPWKLYDDSKKRIAALEQENAQLKEKLVPEADRETFTKRLTETEKRNKELEDEIRYVNYQKSDEFKTKYEAPYESAWKAAMAELSEIAIFDPQTNQTRAVEAQDLLNLINLPLGEARKMANAQFGDFADDVMAHRKSIRNIFEERTKALEEAKTKGAERDKLRMEQYKQQQKETGEAIKKTWDTVNHAALKHERYGKYFVPVEGDEEGNQRLGKGYQLVDRAFSEDPRDPRLTADQRRDVIERHAAVRNRAAAFGRLVHQNTQLLEKLEALEKELGQYKASTPATTTEARPPANGHPASARASMFDALRKLAK